MTEPNPAPVEAAQANSISEAEKLKNESTETIKTNNEKLTELEKKLALPYQERVEKKYGLLARGLRRLIGPESFEALERWTEETDVGKTCKSLFKIGVGTSAAIGANILTGGVGLIATPLLLGLGTKKAVEGVIELAQYWMPKFTSKQRITYKQFEYQYDDQTGKIIGLQYEADGVTPKGQEVSMMSSGRSRRMELQACRGYIEAKIIELKKKARDFKLEGGQADQYNLVLTELEEFTKNIEVNKIKDIKGSEYRSLKEIKEDLGKWEKSWSVGKDIISTTATLGVLGYQLLAGSGINLDLDLDKTKHAVKFMDGGWKFIFDPVKDHMVGSGALWGNWEHTAAQIAAKSATIRNLIITGGTLIAGLAVDSAIVKNRVNAAQEEINKPDRNLGVTFGKLDIVTTKAVENAIVQSATSEELKDFREKLEKDQIWKIEDKLYKVKEIDTNKENLRLQTVDENGNPILAGNIIDKKVTILIEEVRNKKAMLQGEQLKKDEKEKLMEEAKKIAEKAGKPMPSDGEIWFLKEDMVLNGTQCARGQKIKILEKRDILPLVRNVDENGNFVGDPYAVEIKTLVEKADRLPKDAQTPETGQPGEQNRYTSKLKRLLEQHNGWPQNVSDLNTNQIWRFNNRVFKLDSFLPNSLTVREIDDVNDPHGHQFAHQQPEEFQYDVFAQSARYMDIPFKPYSPPRQQQRQNQRQGGQGQGGGQGGQQP